MSDCSWPVTTWFFIPPMDGTLFLAALVAGCLRGGFPPVDLRAVCSVRVTNSQLCTICYTRNMSIFVVKSYVYKALLLVILTRL